MVWSSLMPIKGTWDWNVYRTDVDPEEYVGFFFDKAQADGWVNTRTEGTYEVTQRKPARDRVVVPPDTVSDDPQDAPDREPQATEEVANEHD